MVRKTKNIIKREIKLPDGSVFYSFISKSTGSIIEVEEHLNNMLLNSQPYRTVKSKASDLARFYDYYIEASYVIHSPEYLSALKHDPAFSNSQKLRTTLTAIFNAYPSYLLDATRSKNLLANICAKNLEAKKVKRTSAKRMLSSLTDYILASNAQEYSLKIQKKANGLLDLDQDANAIGNELSQKQNLRYSERKALIENSYLASCISGGARVARIKNFFKLPRENKIQKPKHFPIKHIGTFLLNTKYHRDKAMYALCFGGGLRFSEATRLKFDNISVMNEEVQLNSKEIINYLDSIDYLSLSNKHIAHYIVTLVEPFKSFFFDELTKYLEIERPKSNSNYIFLKNRGEKNIITGNIDHLPYFTSSQAAIQEMWNSNLLRASLNTPEFEDKQTHSMRHFYGVYMRNFAPNSRGGFGHTDEEVQYFMRHEQLKSTKIYSKVDIGVISKQLEITNRILLQRESYLYQNMKKIC
ncbi:tyrosine-type recombinase/integrase [Celerinatantimonas sp. MCCC 1A17872]|uniref:tyrosine-type recombinase/integrase n=1 Tax=Celerinatantimonas sp. MCCC 1A17872 TaxID=3177514 RepID=UPI0038C99ECF